MTDREEAAHAALNQLMTAIGLSGESGTEALFDVLQNAVDDVAGEWHVVEQSHKDGLCYDVNAMLAQAIAKHGGHKR